MRKAGSIELLYVGLCMCTHECDNCVFIFLSSRENNFFFLIKFYTLHLRIPFYNWSKCKVCALEVEGVFPDRQTDWRLSIPNKLTYINIYRICPSLIPHFVTDSQFHPQKKAINFPES